MHKNNKPKRHNKSVKKGGKHTYATISHFKTPPGSFRKSTKRNQSPVYAKLIKKIKKSTSPMLRTLRLKNKVRK